jgi:molecular chaperone IbpA
MLTYDLSPMFRNTVGFDRMQRLMDAATERTEVNYPPYNIETDGKDAYRVTVAVAGFSENDLDVTFENETLAISGNKNDEVKAATLLHHGIAGRNFQLNFNLADHIRVNGASLDNGMLAVDLQREVPEELKQRKIDIRNQSVKSFNDEGKSFISKEKKAA